MSYRFASTLIVSSTLVFALVAGCSGSSNSTPASSPGPTLVNNGAGGAPPSTGAGAGGAGVGGGGGGGTTTTTPTPSAPPDAVILAGAPAMLGPLAAQNAPGASPVGNAIGGFLSPGQSREVQVTLDPSKCYTGIGAGAPPASHVQLELVAPPPAPPMLAQQSQEVTITPVLGKGAACMKNPIPLPVPVPMTVIFRVKLVGGGPAPVIAQLYAK